MCPANNEAYHLMWGKLSSILLPVFLKICNAASATFSSSIFRQPRRDSKVSAEWNDTGCVKDSTCVGSKKWMFSIILTQSIKRTRCAQNKQELIVMISHKMNFFSNVPNFILAQYECLLFTFSSSNPALMASSVGTPSSSSSAVPSIDLLTCFIKALTK